MEDKKKLFGWLAILVAILIAGLGLAGVLTGQGWPKVAYWVAALALLLQFAWLCFGLFAWRERLWVRVSAGLIVGTYAAIALISLSGNWTTHFSKLQPVTIGFMGRAVTVPLPFEVSFDSGGASTAIAIAGIWALSVTFALGLALIMAALTPGHPIIAIARTFLHEAIRMKVAVIFIVLLAVLIPVLATGLDPKERLQYRVQFFLTWSVGVISFTLSLVTIFLTCWSVSSDIQYKQIFMTMTKPIGRWQYLLGKWLGMALLNLLLVTVSTGGVYAFTKVLQHQEAMDQLDRISVDEQVLTARAGTNAVLPKGTDFSAEFRDRVKQLQEENPEMYGSKPDELPDKEANNIKKLLVQRWHTIPPMSYKAYEFNGLSRAKKEDLAVHIRVVAKGNKVPDDGVFRLAMRANGRPIEVPPLIDQVPQVFPIPAWLIDPDGTVVLEVYNGIPGRPDLTFMTDVSFDPYSGLQMLYKVGSFEPNLVRTMTIVWIRLLFLGAVGITAATFLGFHVASLASLLVFFVALSSGFLSEAMTYYAGLPVNESGMASWDLANIAVESFVKHIAEGKFWDAFKLIIRLVGTIAVYLIPSFSEFDGSAQLADGLVVPGALVQRAFVMICGLWMGLCGLIGWAVFRGRELARVIV
jgi:hypothetical protein